MIPHGNAVDEYVDSYGGWWNLKWWQKAQLWLVMVSQFSILVQPKPVPPPIPEPSSGVRSFNMRYKNTTFV